MNGLLRLTGSIATVAALSLTAAAAQAAVIVVNTPGATALATALGSAAGGDTIILAEAGNYGPAAITKPITIIAVHGAGTYSPGNKPCLNINTTVSQAVIILRGYTCSVAGALEDGILWRNGHRLIMDDVTVTNAGGDKCGLRFAPAFGPAGFNISRSSFIRNGLNQGGGICVDSSANAAINGVLEGVISQNGTFGVKSKGEANSPVDILISNSHFARNGTGLSSDGQSSLKVSNSVISGNGVGLSRPNGGEIISLQGNALFNFTDGTFTGTVAKQ